VQILWRQRDPATAWFLVISAAAVLAITLSPGRAPGPPPCPIWNLRCSELDSVDTVLNLGLFVPLGLALGMRHPRALGAFLIPAALSAGIEVLQLIPGLHRTPSVRDVLANGIGGGLGVWLGIHFAALATPDSKLARRALLASSLLLTAGLALGGWLLQPAVPLTIWYGQWAPELGQFDRFAGHLDSVRLMGWPMPSGRIDRTPAFRVRAQETGYELAALVRLGPAAPSGLAPIASVFDDRHHQIALLGQARGALVFSGRIGAQDLRFQGLFTALPGALNGRTTGPVRVDGRRRGGRVILSWAAGDAGAEYTEPLSPIDAWRVLSPWPLVVGPLGAWIGAGLLGLLFLPVGYFGRRADWGPFRTAGAAVVPAVVALVPPGLGLGPAPLAMWAGLIAGWGAGWLAARRPTRRKPASGSGPSPS